MYLAILNIQKVKWHFKLFWQCFEFVESLKRHEQILKIQRRQIKTSSQTSILFIFCCWLSTFDFPHDAVISEQFQVLNNNPIELSTIQSYLYTYINWHVSCIKFNLVFFFLFICFLLNKKGHDMSKAYNYILQKSTKLNR